MFSHGKIIVPLDGTPASEKFLPFVKSPGSRLGCGTAVVAGGRPVDFTSLAVGEHDQWIQAATAEAESYLSEKALALDGVRVERLCRRGPVSQVICQAASPAI